MKRRTPFFITAIVTISLIIGAFWMFSEGTEFLSSTLFYVTALLVFLILWAIERIGRIQENQEFSALTDSMKQKYLAERDIPYLQWLWQDAFGKKQTGEEGDVALLDHGYDGILELDNKLPRWWLGLFYFGVLYCGIYILAFSFSSFAHPVKELEKDMAIAAKQKAAYDSLQPKITIETATFAAADLKEGEKIFKGTCASCHMADGSGQIGPNLTDDYWKNVRQKDLFKNIFDVVYNGSAGTQMAAYGTTEVFSGKDIQNVAAYVDQLNQTTTAKGSAPLGNIVKDWAKDAIPAGATVVEAAGTKADSTQAVKK